LAIIPGASTDRVVLARPQVDSLESTNRGGSESTTEFSSSDSGTVTETFGPTGPATGSLDVPGLPSPEVPGPEAGDDAARNSSDEALPAASPIRAADTDDDSAVPTLMLLGLALLAAVLWLSAGSLGGTADAAETAIDA
jgi:hypothetical protein